MDMVWQENKEKARRASDGDAKQQLLAVAFFCCAPLLLGGVRPKATALEALLDGAPAATIFACGLVGVAARRTAERRRQHHHGLVRFARVFAAYAVFISMLSCVFVVPYLVTGSSLTSAFLFVADDLAHTVSAVCLIGAYAIGAFCWGLGTGNDEAARMRGEDEAAVRSAVPVALFLSGAGYFILAVAPEADMLGVEAKLLCRVLRVACLMLISFVLAGMCKSLAYKGYDNDSAVVPLLLGALMGYATVAALSDCASPLDLLLLVAVAICASFIILCGCTAVPSQSSASSPRSRFSQDGVADGGRSESFGASLHFDVLTTREREAMEARRRGLSSNEAAAQMGVKPSTVRNLQARALRKLNQYDREQDARSAARETSDEMRRGFAPDSACLNVQQPLTPCDAAEARPTKRLVWIVVAMLVLVLWVPIRQRMLALTPFLTPPVNHMGIRIELGTIAGALMLCVRWVCPARAIARSVRSASGLRALNCSRWGSALGLLVLVCCLIVPMPAGNAYHVWGDVLNVLVFAGSALLVYAVGALGDRGATSGALVGDDTSAGVPGTSIELEPKGAPNAILTLSACVWGCVWVLSLFAARSEFAPVSLFDPLLALYGAVSLWGSAHRPGNMLRPIMLCGVTAGVGLVISASLESALLVFSCVSFFVYVYRLPAGMGSRFARIALAGCSVGVVLGLCCSALMGGVQSWLGAAMGTALLVRLGSSGGFMVGTVSVALGLCCVWTAREIALEGDAGEDAVALNTSARGRLEHYFAYRGLNDTQVQVALLVIEGRSRSQIAQQLGYAVGTVNSAKREIYRRLGVCSQTELVESAKNVLQDS